MPVQGKAYASYEGRKDDLWEWDRCEERREESREGRDGAISRHKDQTLIVEVREGMRKEEERRIGYRNKVVVIRRQFLIWEHSMNQWKMKEKNT